MRYVVAALSGLLVAVVTYATLVFLLLIVGGTECDRAVCGPIGEAIAEHGWAFFIPVTVAAVALGVVAARSLAGRR